MHWICGIQTIMVLGTYHRWIRKRWHIFVSMVKGMAAVAMARMVTSSNGDYGRSWCLPHLSISMLIIIVVGSLHRCGIVYLVKRTGNRLRPWIKSWFRNWLTLLSNNQILNVYIKSELFLYFLCVCCIVGFTQKS